MVDKHLAERLLPHLPTGPALDLVIGHAPWLEEVGAPPSDPVAEQLLRTRDRDAVCRLVKRLTSPELLIKLARSERRVAVQRALGTNRHLPAQARALLAQRACDRRDETLGDNLLVTAGPAERLELMAAFPTLPLPSRHPRLAMIKLALESLGDDELTLTWARAAAHREEAWHIATGLAAPHRDDLPPVSATTLLTLTGIAGRYATSERDASVRERFAERLLPLDADHTHQHQVVATLPEWREIRARLLHLVKEGTCALTMAQVFAGASPDAWEHLATQARKLDLEVDADTAAVLDVPNPAHGKYFPATLEARRLLAGSAHPQVAARHLPHLPLDELAAALAAAAADVLDRVALQASQLPALYAAGLPDPVLFDLAVTQPLVFSAASDLHRHLVSAAPANVLERLDLAGADGEVIAARFTPEATHPLTQADEDLAWKILTKGTELEPLSDTARRTLAAQLAEDHFRDWWRAGCFPAHLPAAGDLTWLVENTDRAPALAEMSASTLGTDWGGGAPVWLPEAAELLPLPWGTLLDPAAVRVLAATLLEHFGDDLGAFGVALKMLPTWVGTLSDLVGTVQAVTAAAGAA